MIEIITLAPPEAHGEVSIYLLADPRDNAVKYVGQTTRPKERHRIVNRGKDVPVESWKMALRASKLTPKMYIVDQVDTLTATETETNWIRRMIDHGCDLLNVNQVHRPVVFSSDEVDQFLLVNMSVPQASEYLGISRQSVHQAIKNGTVAANRDHGRDWWIERDEVAAYKSRTQPDGTPVKAGRPKKPAGEP